jgi:hypothetical protein
MLRYKVYPTKGIAFGILYTVPAYDPGYEYSTITSATWSRSTLHPGPFEAHPGAIKAYFGAVAGHIGAVEGGALVDIPFSYFAHPFN